jgi:hypothetical protein
MEARSAAKFWCVLASSLVSKTLQIEKCKGFRSGENGGKSHTLEYQRSLALKAKAHLFGLGALVDGGGAPVPFSGIDAARPARPQGAATAEICVSMCRFSAISAVATPMAATKPSERTDRRRHPVEGARASPAAHESPQGENKQPGHLQARAACQNSSLAKPPPS